MPDILGVNGAKGHRMLIEVRVVPNAKKNRVLEEERKLKAYVSAPAEDLTEPQALTKTIIQLG